MTNFRFFSLLILTLSQSVIAQQLSYYIVGEDELADYKVYSLLQDHEMNLWLSTDNGLLKYDSYKFTRYSNSKMLNSELFGLKMDNTGKVFCHNLNGQIFFMQNDSLMLYHEVPDSLISNYMEFIFDNKNEILVAGKSYFIIDNEKKIHLLNNFNNNNNINLSSMCKNGEDELAFIINKDEVIYLKNGKFRKELIENILPNSKYYYKLMFDGENEILGTHFAEKVHAFIKKKHGKFQLLNFRNKNLSNNQSSLSVQSLAKNLIFIHNENGGFYLFKINGEPLHTSNKMLKNFFISANIVDKEGNIILGTFGKGLIVIPNQNIVDFRNHSLLKEQKILSMASNEKNSIYLGTRSGEVFKIDSNNTVSKIIQNKTKVEFLKYFPQEQILFIAQKPYFNGVPRELPWDMSTVKSIIKVSDSEYLIGTNIGLTFFDIHNKDLELANTFAKNPQTTKTKQRIYIKTGRVSSLAYDSTAKKICVSTSTGLKIISPKKIQKIQHKGENISANSILFYKNSFWVATFNKGILKISNDKVSSYLNKKKGLLSESVRKIQFHKNKLYIATKNGFQVYDLHQKKFSNYTITDGLLSNNILDFEILGKKVWLLTSKGLQFFIPSKVKKNTIPPNITFTEIKINGKNVKINAIKKLSYNQNQIEFTFLSKAYRHRGRLKYIYRLKGSSEVWDSTDFSSNFAKYSALSSGDYIFQVKAINENNIESKTIELKFSIALPFWRTWWFILLSILLISLVISLIFILRINAIKKRNLILAEKQTVEKNLIDSRLTALRSQMNPHFVFNALNSIQEYIVLNEKRLAAKYLGKFADLMRLYLNHSKQKTITLEEEIQAISLYLELEKIRFEDSLEYTLKIDKSLDYHNITIPPMLIQPYVENAIKHGLLHKEQNRRLSVELKSDKSQQILICEITDNGIGRKASQEINKTRHIQRLDFATSATKTRLNLLNYDKKKPIGENTIDLYDDDKNPIGTKVILHIPIEKSSVS